MAFDLTNILLAGAISVTGALLSEAINYYFVYRHDDYKKLVKDIIESQSRIDIMKEKQLSAAST